MAWKRARQSLLQTTTAIITILLVGAVGGCQTGGSGVMGRNAADGERVPLMEGGPHSGRFATRDMAIAYQYHVKDGKLFISGTADIKYANIEKLSMTLYYLDENGNVIDYDRFFAKPRKVARGKVMDNTFSREFDMAVGAKAFSIGYTGKTRQTQNKGSWVFQHSPF